jgi:predicted hydroxymethylglutaryl-CoA synthase
MENPSAPRSSVILKPERPVGIIGYGAYVPRYRLPATEVARVWTGGKGGLPIKEKAVPGLDEDVATMSIEAARNAMKRARIDPQELRAVWVGSESHPYAVKPTSTLVAEAIGAVPHTQAADWEFACKAGTEALVAAMALVGSGMGRYAMAIGMDTAQGKPGDALEYTAGAGGAAYIVGPASEAVAIINGSFSYVTDTPDFWRRPEAKYPEHGMRFTGEPAYFKHIAEAASHLMESVGSTERAALDAGDRGARRSDPDGVFRIRRRLGRLRYRGDRRAAGPQGPRRRDARLRKAPDGNRLRDLCALSWQACHEVSGRPAQAAGNQRPPPVYPPRQTTG